MNLEAQVLSAIGAAEIGPSQGLLVAVSGGVDSVVLLHLLALTRKQHGLRLEVAHADHQLRAGSADDPGFVAQLAKGLGVPWHCEKLQVASHAADAGISIEMAGRELRHAFLARLAVERGIRHVALAHHGDDQVELFLLRMVRGASGGGLGGMRVLSRSPADPEVALIRPLLDATKADLVEYATKHELPFREDVTNSSLDLPRNRVRNELIPLLRGSYGLGPGEGLRRTMELLRAESDFIKEEAGAWLETLKAGRRSKDFQGLAVAVQRQAVYQQLLSQGLDASFDLVETLRLRPGVPTTVVNGREIMRDHTGLVRECEKCRTFRCDELSLELNLAGQAEFAGARLEWTVESACELLDRRVGLEVFDADTVGKAVLLRHWRAGDRFQPSGMPRSVKLQDLWTNAKVPLAQRHLRVVGQTSSNTLFWAEGLRISELHKVRGATRRQLVWRWSRDP